MLPDAGSIQESEVAVLNRRNAARGRAEVSPIYTQADAIASLQSFTPVDYEKWIDVIPGVRARLDAGHLLGSASVEIEFSDENCRGIRCAFASGDIGPDAKLLQPDPEAPAGFDYVIVESTYGDRDRAPITADARRARLSAEVRDAASRKGALLIPAFAVERTQELIVDLVDLMERGEVPSPQSFSIPRSRSAPLKYFASMPEIRPCDRCAQAFGLAAAALHRNGGREQGYRQADRFPYCYRRRRHVRRRTYPASSEELAVECAGHRPASRLPGPGNTWPVSR